MVLRSQSHVRAKQSYESFERTSLLPEFANEKGYWSVNYPTQMVDTRLCLRVRRLPIVRLSVVNESLRADCPRTAGQQRVS